MWDVIAIIVTCNRKELLLECLESVIKQTYVLKGIILVDNASTDGTEEEIKKRGYLDNFSIKYIKMKKNTGGSGGFYEGLRLAKQYKCDWIWLMDDDTIPTRTCLEKLIAANKIVDEYKTAKNIKKEAKISFFASAIYGPEKEFMNLPQISTKPSKNGYAYWYQFLEKGLVNIENATFVSILIKKEAVLQCGLPCKDYFIWGDDSEYTMRLTKYYGDAYFVGNSVAIHKRKNAKKLSLDSETDCKRIDMYHYLYRNQAINYRYYKLEKHPFWCFIKGIVGSGQYLFKPMGIRKARAVVRGNCESIFQYSRFAKYIDKQIANGRLCCSNKNR